MAKGISTISKVKRAISGTTKEVTKGAKKIAEKLTGGEDDRSSAEGTRIRTAKASKRATGAKSGAAKRGAKANKSAKRAPGKTRAASKKSRASSRK